MTSSGALNDPNGYTETDRKAQELRELEARTKHTMAYCSRCGIGPFFLWDHNPRGLCMDCKRYYGANLPAPETSRRPALPPVQWTTIADACNSWDLLLDEAGEVPHLSDVDRRTFEAASEILGRWYSQVCEAEAVPE